jgi:hypothetical protein
MSTPCHVWFPSLNQVTHTRLLNQLYIQISGHQEGRNDRQVTSYGDLLQVTLDVLTLQDNIPEGFFPTSGSDEGKEIGSFRQITGGNFLHLEIPKDCPPGIFPCV